MVQLVLQSLEGQGIAVHLCPGVGISPLAAVALQRAHGSKACACFEPELNGGGAFWCFFFFLENADLLYKSKVQTEQFYFSSELTFSAGLSP